MWFHALLELYLILSSGSSTGCSRGVNILNFTLISEYQHIRADQRIKPYMGPYRKLRWSANKSTAALPPWMSCVQHSALWPDPSWYGFTSSWWISYSPVFSLHNRVSCKFRKRMPSHPCSRLLMLAILSRRCAGNLHSIQHQGFPRSCSC